MFIDSFVVSALQDAGGYAISPKITSSCILVATPVDWVILHWYAFGADGQSLGRAVGQCTVTWLPNFLGWVDYVIFLPMVLRWRASCVRALLKSWKINYVDLTLQFSLSIFIYFCYQPKKTTDYYQFLSILIFIDWLLRETLIHNFTSLISELISMLI